MGSIRFSVDDDGIATIVLDNPSRRNAVDAAMAGELRLAWDEVDGDDAIRVAVVTGAGTEAFCSGGDVKAYVEAGTFGPDGTGARREIPKPWPMRKPVVAAIRGYAVGGGFGLALACDLRVVGRSARLGSLALQRGIPSGAQQTSRLVRLVSLSRALELLLLGRVVAGDEAVAIGLAHAVVADEEVLDVAVTWARQIAAFDPWAVQATKRLAYETQDLPLDAAFEREEEALREAIRREGARERFGAFVDGRPPDFGG